MTSQAFVTAASEAEGEAKREKRVARFSGKTAIVTGATSGIGEHIARRLAAEGATVALIGRRRDRGEQVAKGIVENGGKAFYVEADVTDSKSVEMAFKTSVEKFGSGTISILVNSAGVSTGNPPMEYFADSDWNKVMDTNAKGTYLSSKAAIPFMIKGGGGSIVNVSSSAGLKGYAGGTAYAASKAAVIRLTEVLALEHGKDRIRANSVLPGTVRTEMFEGSIRSYANRMGGQQGAPSAEQVIENISKRIPAGRIGEPDDVANLVLFLASEEASYINGAGIVVDGGQSL
jgi:NAD(P)-dependent dehydrogenase (short-subunit alcohol dehydrogenase family)